MMVVEGFKALGLGFLVLAVVFLVGGMPYISYQIGVLFGGLAIAMFICHGIDWLLGDE